MSLEMLSEACTHYRPTKVVSVRVNDIRPQYKNLYEWTQDPNNVYIGKRKAVQIGSIRFPMSDSIFANPFMVGRDGTISRVMKLYRYYLISLVEQGVITPEIIIFLRGKILGCFCKTKKTPNAYCHGDVMVEVLGLF